MERVLVAVFDSRDQAQAACQAVRNSGIDEDRVHLRDAEGASDTTSADRGDSGEHRGFFARLFGMEDTTREHVGEYSEAVRRGGSVVVVDGVDDERVDEVASLLTQKGAIDIDERATQWRASGWRSDDDDERLGGDTSESRAVAMDDTTSSRSASAATGFADTGMRDVPEPMRDTRSTMRGDANRLEGGTRIPVVEEQLQVGKRELTRGGVRIHTRVSERPVEENVTLREERARLERHPTDRPASEADLGAAFKEGSIELTERAEEPVVQKTARVVEEVEVGKEVTERTETVRDTVRRSDVEIEDLPGSRTSAQDDTRMPNRR